MSVQRVTYAVFVAVFVAVQVMTVSPFGLLGNMNMSAETGMMGTSPLAQMLTNWKMQANTAARPFVSQMIQPLNTIATNMLNMLLLGAQMMNNVAKEKLTYLSNMAQQQPAGTTPTAAPTPAPAPSANATNSTSG